MPLYQLKPGMERFRMVDGPYENRQYLPGIVYTDIPPNEADRFEQVSAAAAVDPPKVYPSQTAVEVENEKYSSN